MKRIQYLKITFGGTCIYCRVKNINLQIKMKNIIKTLVSQGYDDAMIQWGDRKKFDI
jgi:hypothetical protein